MPHSKQDNRPVIDPDELLDFGPTRWWRDALFTLFVIAGFVAWGLAVHVVIERWR